MTTDPRPVQIEAIGPEAIFLTIGAITIPLNSVELQSLTHEAVRASVTLSGRN